MGSSDGLTRISELEKRVDELSEVVAGRQTSPTDGELERLYAHDGVCWACIADDVTGLLSIGEARAIRQRLADHGLQAQWFARDDRGRPTRFRAPEDDGE